MVYNKLTNTGGGGLPIRLENTMRLVSALALAASVALAAPASAATVFSDGFETDAAGTGKTALNNWTVYFGNTVDVVAASNVFGITVGSPASGNVIDIDGTPGPGGIRTIQNFAFNAGDLVTLTFDVGGAQRGSVSDNFGAGFFVDPTLASNITGTGLTSAPGVFFSPDQVSQAINIAGATPFTTSSISFTATGAGSLQLGFRSLSADNVGPLLDNVRLDVTAAVPEPSTWALMLLGFGFVGAALRRRRQTVRYNFA
jgi:hypothetical protein